MQSKTNLINMLGIKSSRAPIGGVIAKEIRSAVARIFTGQLNEKDRASINRSIKSLSRYKANWIGHNGQKL